MHLLVDLYLVVRKLVLLRESYVDLGGLAYLEDELMLGIVVEVEIALLLRRDHITHIVDALLLEILEDGVRGGAVRLLGHGALAVHLAYDAHGNHTRTESRDVGLALVVAKHLVDSLAIILLVDQNLQ